MVRIGIIGDIHHQFTHFDVDFFNNSAYDLLLCTGDLPYDGSIKDQHLVSLLTSLTKPTLLIPGNHDCVNKAQFLAEAAGASWLANRSHPQQQKLVEELRIGLSPVVMCGYSTHEFLIDGFEFCIIAARPLSFGGPDLRYRRYLETNFAIDSLQASTKRFQDLINGTGTRHILFLSHNGPTGLGSTAEDIWGCDFKPQAGDYGDPDLGAAITYAKNKGRNVLAVIAGHMHHSLQNGGIRQWLVRKENTTYVNAARVPRIFTSNRNIWHHHVSLSIDQNQIAAEEMLVANH